MLNRKDSCKISRYLFLNPTTVKNLKQGLLFKKPSSEKPAMEHSGAIISKPNSSEAPIPFPVFILNQFGVFEC